LIKLHISIARMNILVSHQAVPPTFCNKIAPMSGIVKKRALKQNENTNVMLSEMLEIVLTLKILRPPEIGGPRLKPF